MKDIKFAFVLLLAMVSQVILFGMVADLVLHHIDSWKGRKNCSGEWYCLPFTHLYRRWRGK